jgi:hypothetical protein
MAAAAVLDTPSAKVARPQPMLSTLLIFLNVGDPQ